MHDWKYQEYWREIPRDLFNEAKLLNGLGRLCLLIHDGMGLGIIVEFHYNTNAAFIPKLCDDGYLHIPVLRFTKNGNKLIMRSVYNRKHGYALMCQMEDNNEEYEVFENDGSFTEEFTTFINQL